MLLEPRSDFRRREVIGEEELYPAEAYRCCRGKAEFTSVNIMLRFAASFGMSCVWTCIKMDSRRRPAHP